MAGPFPFPYPCQRSLSKAEDARRHRCSCTHRISFGSCFPSRVGLGASFSRSEGTPLLAAGLLGLACTLSPQARRPAELFSLSAFAWFTGLYGSARPKSQESRLRLQAKRSAGHSRRQPSAQPSMDLLFSAPSQRQVPLHCSSRRQIPTGGIHRTRQQPKRS